MMKKRVRLIVILTVTALMLVAAIMLIAQKDSKSTPGSSAVFVMRGECICEERL